jgi:hypothetical protein
MTTVLDKYFYLADHVPFDESSMAELINLFADDAEIQPVGSERVRGKAAIRQLFQIFCETYASIQRVWQTQETDKGLEAIWAVAGKRCNGRVFAMHGRHIAQVDAEGKIANLQIELLIDPS